MKSKQVVRRHRKKKNGKHKHRRRPTSFGKKITAFLTMLAATPILTLFSCQALDSLQADIRFMYRMNYRHGTGLLSSWKRRMCETGCGNVVDCASRKVIGTLRRDWRIFEASQLSPEEILRLWVGNAFISCMVENYQSIECKNESKRHFYQSKNDFVIRLVIIREMPRNQQTMYFLNVVINNIEVSTNDCATL